jgi:hypothetical protein
LKDKSNGEGRGREEIEKRIEKVMGKKSSFGI